MIIYTFLISDIKNSFLYNCIYMYNYMILYTLLIRDKNIDINQR